MSNPIIERMDCFIGAYGRGISSRGASWRYFRLGDGPAALWLTGGLRRAAFGYRFLERLADGHTVIAPDYPLP